VNLVSDTAFRALISLITGGFAAVWAVHDVLFLSRTRGAPRGDPLISDQRFGYVMGIVIGVVGIIGTLRFNGVL
jgi:hypothetical protein